MHRTSLTHSVLYALLLGSSIALVSMRPQAAPRAPQSVDLQASTPGVQQSGNSNISGTGLFGTSVGIGTSSPLAGLHVNDEAIPPGGTLALEGTTHTYMTFFPKGAANGRKAHFGFPSQTSTAMWLANEQTFGDIVLWPGQYGGVGVNASSIGAQKLMVYTSDANGYAVWGDTSYGTGSTYGVFGRSSSTSGFGVYGLSLATTGSATGTVGRSDSTSGRGVYAYCTKTTGTNYGLYAYTGSAQGYAVYAQGRLAASGTKSFVIDHPFDPANMTLTHYCTEGEEPLNAYRGKVVLDASGSAWIALPEYFEEINADPTYTLTAIGAAMPSLHVASEVRENRFRIAGGVPGGKVSWRVEAVRNDRFVQSYGAPVEQVKPAEMRGKFLSPELYGQPLERGVHHIAETGAQH